MMYPQHESMSRLPQHFHQSAIRTALSSPHTTHVYPLPCTNAPFVAAAAAVPAAPSIGMVAGHSNYSFRNTRLFDRNPTTWVPQAPMRNGE